MLLKFLINVYLRFIKRCANHVAHVLIRQTRNYVDHILREPDVPYEFPSNFIE